MSLFSQRWAVNMSSWLPDQEEFNYLLKLLPAAAQLEVSRNKFPADRQRALISRLLQRKCLLVACSEPFSRIDIQRTKGGKPFCASPCNRCLAPNLNFSVSHEGDFIVLAAEPLCICGIDVSAPPQARKTVSHSISSIRHTFQKQFTSAEWSVIESAENHASQLQAFQKYWSLKEAFVKARGDGLGFDLGRVEFELAACTTFPLQSATAKVDGKALHRWRFSVQGMGDHVVAVALGPPQDVVDAWGKFTGTFAKAELAEGELQAALDVERPAFSLLGISDIIPLSARGAYAEAGGDLLL